AQLSVDVALALIALGTSLVTGLIGAGGAILFIPVALHALKPIVGVTPDAHLVTGAATVQGVAAVSAAALQYARRGAIERATLGQTGPALGVGSVAGAALSVLVPSRALLLLYALLTSSA